MLIESQSANPAVHEISVNIANRCVWIISALLRDEEKLEAQQEFYRVCREELDKKPGREEEV